jgi:hypothetical protein
VTVPYQRRSRPRVRETFCAYCDSMVGVIATRFNHNRGDDVPKTSRHKRPDGRWCPGSQLSVPAVAVMEVSA